MTPEERAEARRLADAATEGPWILGEPWGSGTLTVKYKNPAEPGAYTGFSAPSRDAAFIAASRTLIPQLLDALDGAERKLNDVLDYAGHHNHCPAAVYSVGVPVFCNCGWDNMRRKHRES